MKNDKLGSGIAIGLAIGIALGLAMDNIGAGIAIGMGIGVAFGVAFSDGNGDGDEGELPGGSQTETDVEGRCRPGKDAGEENQDPGGDWDGA